LRLGDYAAFLLLDMINGLLFGLRRHIGIVLDRFDGAIKRFVLLRRDWRFRRFAATRADQKRKRNASDSGFEGKEFHHW